MIIWVRDPRAYIASRRLSLGDTPYTEEDMAKDCQVMEKFARDLFYYQDEWKMRFRLLRYEDFVNDPDYQVKELFKFLYLDHHENITEFLYQETHLGFGNSIDADYINLSRGKNFDESTLRDASRSPYKYLETSTYEDICKIQSQLSCKKVIDYFSYELLNEESYYKHRNIYVNQPEEFHWDVKWDNVPVKMMYGKTQREIMNPQFLENPGTDGASETRDFLQAFSLKIWGWETYKYRIDQILPNLYLSGVFPLTDKSKMDARNITHVLSLINVGAVPKGSTSIEHETKIGNLVPGHFYQIDETQTKPSQNPITFRVYKKLTDGPSMLDLMRQAIPECIEFIHNGRKTGGSVSVHCIAGRSRSASVTMAYMMVVTNTTFDQVYATMTDKREINPNKGFLELMRSPSFGEEMAGIRTKLQLTAEEINRDYEAFYNS